MALEENQGQAPAENGGADLKNSLVNANEALANVIEGMQEQGAPDQAIAPFAKLLSDFRSNVQSIMGDGPKNETRRPDQTRGVNEGPGSKPAPFIP